MGITLLIMVVASLAVAIYLSWPLLVNDPRKDTAAPSESEEEGIVLDELLVQKESTYSAIKELEFDHAMGNLSNSDYRELARRYEDKAVALLKTIDEVSQAPLATATRRGMAGTFLAGSSSPGPGDAVEREVAALRHRRGKGNDRARSQEEEIERQVSAFRSARRPQLVATGNEADEIEERVALLRASRRGNPPTASAPAKRACPACSVPLKNPSAAFCSRCGAGVRARCPACGDAAEAEDLFCSTCGTRLVPDSGSDGKPILTGEGNA